MELCTKTRYVLERFLGESAMYAETITEYKTAQSRCSNTQCNPIRLPEEVQSCKGTSTSVLNAVPSDILFPPYELWDSKYREISWTSIDDVKADAENLHNARIEYLCQYEGCARGEPGNGFPLDWKLDAHVNRAHRFW
jgi:hypothetical protein